MIKPQSDFPLLDVFQEYFPVDKKTVFAYDNIIYSNYDLPEHLIIHEETHHKQQSKYGLDTWVERYLNEDEFRLEMEIEAYRNEVNSIKDRNNKTKIKVECAKKLSGPLYNNLLSYEEALDKLSTV